jgi:hypothetical protein
MRAAGATARLAADVWPAKHGISACSPSLRSGTAFPALGDDLNVGYRYLEVRSRGRKAATATFILGRPLFLSWRSHALRLCYDAALGDMPQIVQRGAQDFSLRLEPVSVGRPVLAAAFEPQVIGTLADRVFNVLHRGSPIFEWSPRVPSSNERPAAVTPLGFVRAAAGQVSGSVAS